MSKKIGCGGFRIDDDTLKLKDDGTLYAAGGGGSIPKPLTYDYMPEGYPSKSIGTVTLMEEQVVEFVSRGDGSPSIGTPTNAFTPVEGQTYAVNWDGTEYECVCSIFNGSYLVLGNLSIMGAGDDTGEPFIYINVPSRGSEFETLDTASSHTISVKKTGEIFTPIAEEFLPVASEENYGVVKKDEIVTAYVFPNNSALQIEMNKAIDDFIAGKASISWKHANIIYAERPSDTEIHVKLSDNPTNYVKCVASENFGGSYYHLNLGESIRSDQSESSMAGIQLYNYDDPSIGSIAIRASIDSNNPANNHVSFGPWASIYGNGIVIKSSSGTKKFKITVNDSGTISATEVTS